MVDFNKSMEMGADREDEPWGTKAVEREESDWREGGKRERMVDWSRGGVEDEEEDTGTHLVLFLGGSLKSGLESGEREGLDEEVEREESLWIEGEGVDRGREDAEEGVDRGAASVLELDVEEWEETTPHLFLFFKEDREETVDEEEEEEEDVEDWEDWVVDEESDIWMWRNGKIEMILIYGRWNR
jgi:hypothetical protein